MRNKQVRFLFRLVIFCFSILATSTTIADDHVRVLLDTSISMRSPVDGYPPQDPKKLSVLSIKLLTDLLYPIFSSATSSSSNYDSSYEIFTFNKDYGSLPSSAFPSHKKNIGLDFFKLEKSKSAWKSLQKNLTSIQRKAKVTYFYPGLRSVVTSFGKSKEDDTRIIVLITDGRSDSEKTRYGGSSLRYTEEKEKLQLLADEMESKNIKLFILAFGATIDPEFLEYMIKTSQGNSIGEIVPITSTEELMAGMARIFSEEFGYSIKPDPNTQPYYTTNSPRLLNLNGNSNNKFVGVLSMVDDVVVPDFSLSPSTGAKNSNIKIYNRDHLGETISQRTNTSSLQLGGGYYLKWVDSPSGKYEFTPNLPSTQKLIILHPLNIDAGVAGVGKPQLSVMEERANISVMANINENIIYYAKTTGVSGGIPERNINVVFTRRKGIWDGTKYSNSAWNTFDYELAPSCKPLSSCSITPLLSSKSAWFHQNINFPKNNIDVNDFYEASIPVKASFKSKIVGSAINENAKRVNVYPFMSFVPSPSEVKIKKLAASQLDIADSQCASFKLVNQGDYYNDFKNEISIEANLTINPSTVNAAEILNKATFTLDGMAIENPSIKGGILWGNTYRKSNRSTLEQLKEGLTLVSGEYKHNICVNIGFPIKGGKVDLSLNLSISEPPYNRIHRVIAPLQIHFSVKPPSWNNWKLLYLIPLLMLLWFLKFIPNIEDDLGFILYDNHDGSEGFKLLYSNLITNFFRRLLNLSSIYEIRQGGSAIALIRPISNNKIVDDLYAIKITHKKARLTSVKQSNIDSSDIKHEGSWSFIEVNHPYKIFLNDAEYTFRLEFRND